jgi:serine/threonine-protein phosphatase 2A regulatory subunit B'
MAAQRNTLPLPASPRRKSTTLLHLFELDSKNKSKSPKISLYLSNSENEELLSIITYFTSPLESPSPQDLKRLKLTQLLSIIKLKKTLHDQTLAPLMSMLSTNLFRPLPPPSNTSITSDFPDDEDPISNFSPKWSHLQILYDILLRVVATTDPETLKEHVDHPFLLNLLSLFQSEDPRERDILKNLYHRIYLRFTFYRDRKHKQMTNKDCGIIK